MLRQSLRVTVSELGCRNQMHAYVLHLKWFTLNQSAMLLHFTWGLYRLGTQCFEFLPIIQRSGFWQHTTLLTSGCQSQGQHFPSKECHPYPSWDLQTPCAMENSTQHTGITLIWRPTCENCLRLNQWDIKFKYLQCSCNGAKLKWKALLCQLQMLGKKAE